MYWKILANITTHGEFAPRSIATSLEAVVALIILLMLLKIKSDQKGGWTSCANIQVGEQHVTFCPTTYFANGRNDNNNNNNNNS